MLNRLTIFLTDEEMEALVGLSRREVRGLRAAPQRTVSPRLAWGNSPVYEKAVSWYIHPMTIQRDLRIDKKAFSVTSLFTPSDEKAFWFSKSPYERLQAVELQRQIIYGYRPSSARLQRVFTVAQRSPS